MRNPQFEAEQLQVNGGFTRTIHHAAHANLTRFLPINTHMQCTDVAAQAGADLKAHSQLAAILDAMAHCAKCASHCVSL